MIHSSLLNQLDGIVHGFGTKESSVPVEAWQAKQIHSDQIIELSGQSIPESGSVEGDAIVTALQAQPIAIRTADCVPILMVAPDVPYIAAVHAGWRGMAAQIINKVIAALVNEKGAKPEELRVAIGPCISAQRYEVDDEVAKMFVGAPLAAPLIDGASQGSPLQSTGNGKYLLDLAQANRHCLLEDGVRPEHIDVIDLCTYEREDLFYSYRRDGDGTGRNISWIKLL